jgi:hypothetical protein
MAADIIQQQNDLKAHRVAFILMPNTWRAFQGNPLPCCWQVIKLDETAKRSPRLTQQPGIYTLLVQPGIATHPACSYLMYVGQTHNLRQRFHNYLVTEKKKLKRPNIFRLLNIYEGYIWFCFTEVDAGRLDEYENALMNAYIPPSNADNRLPAEIRASIGAF